MPLVSFLRARAVTRIALLVSFVLSAITPLARAQCPTEPTLQFYTGGGTNVCPCFVPGEQAGVIFNAPAEHYPIEILRVGVGWGSAFGGAPNTIESALHVYPAGLPAPGAPLFTLEGPQLVDGAINEFNLEPLPGSVVVNSGPFMVALEFANTNAGDPFSPSVIHDGNGCQAGKNAIFAIPGGWLSACTAGVTGDWVFHVVYRRVDCTTDVESELLPDGTVAMLFAPRPNPARNGTEMEYVVARDAEVSVVVFDVHGRTVRELFSGHQLAGRHRVSWDGADARGERAPAGMYLVQLSADGAHSMRKVALAE